MKTVTTNTSKSPPQRLWKALNQITITPQKVLPIRKKMIRTRKQVSFSDELQVVRTAICLSEADEDFLWWTEDELELIVTTAKALGELDTYREGLIRAQFKRQDVLQEQNRLRELGQLGSDWSPIARVSRKGSSDSSRKARLNGIENETLVFQDSENNNPMVVDSPSNTCSSRCTDFTRLLRSRFIRSRPVFESRFETNEMYHC